MAATEILSAPAQAATTSTSSTNSPRNSSISTILRQAKQTRNADSSSQVNHLLDGSSLPESFNPDDDNISHLDDIQLWTKKFNNAEDAWFEGEEDESDDQEDDRINEHEHEQEEFGDESKISWVFACFLIIAGTVSLGALAMASNYAVLGFIPATFMVIILGILASYTGFLMWDFYMMNREHEITNYGQAARLVLGEKFGTLVHIEQCILLFWFISATIKSAGEAMYALSQAHYCLAIVTVIATLIGIILSYPIYLRGVSMLSAVSFASIVISMFVNILGVAAQGSPDYSLPRGANANFLLFPPATSDAKAILASTTTIIFSYAGHLVFFEFIHAMRRPKDFLKALALAQTFAISSYGVVGSIIYHYTGMFSKSPALFNLAPSDLYAIMGWLAVLPNLFIGGVIDSNVLCHNIVQAVSPWISSPFAPPSKNSGRSGSHANGGPESELQESDTEFDDVEKEKQRFTNMRDGEATVKSDSTTNYRVRIMWTAVTALVWLISYVVSQIVPTFNGILGITSSIFSTQFTYGLPCVFWLISVYRKGRLRKRWFLASINVLIVLLSVVILVMGTLVNLRSLFNRESRAFSCSV